MAANWVQCTSRADSFTSVWINIDQAHWIEARGGYSRIGYAGDADAFYDVLEPVEEILEKVAGFAPGT